MRRPCALAGIAALVGLFATPARAATIYGDTLIATGGDVIVTFVSNGAGYSSDLFLDGTIGDEFGVVFNNWTTAVGTAMNLGSFTQGQELVFKLFVQQTGDVFYTGDGSRNLDGLVHAVLDSTGQQVLVGFEDVRGGGDLDYNDLVFAFTNVLGVTDPGGGEGVTPGGGSAGGSGSAVGDDGAPPSAGGLPGAGSGGSNVDAPPTQPVDEPSTLMLLGTGLVMVGAVTRRQSLPR